MTYIVPFSCSSCDYELADVIEHEGRTALSLFLADGATVLIIRGRIMCPKCRISRTFVSVSMKAIRLGIADA